MRFLQPTRRDRVNAWLRRYSAPVGVACAAGQVFAGIAAHKAWNRDFAPWNREVGIAAVTAVLVCTAIAWLTVEASKSILADRTIEDICRRLIQMLAESCRSEGGHIRGNIMYVTAAGTRKVHEATAYNMGDDTD